MSERPPKTPESEKPSIGTWVPDVGSPRSIVGIEQGPFMSSPDSNGIPVEHSIVEFPDGSKESVPATQISMHPSESASVETEGMDENAKGAGEESIPQTDSSMEGELLLENALPTAPVTRVERDATPAEMRSATEEAVEELELRPDQDLSLVKQEWYQELAHKAGVASERDAATAALEAREEPLKRYLAVQKRLKKKKLLSTDEAAEFQAARKEYERSKAATLHAQLAYAGKLQDSAKERIKERYAPERAEAIMARYNRLIRVREIVIPAAQQEQKVREQLLDESGRNLFQKVLKWNTDLTARMERGAESLIKKTPWGRKMSGPALERASRITARMTRLVGFATAGTALGLITTALAGGPAAAALIAAAGGRIAYGSVSTGVGALAGYGLGKNFERTKGAARRDVFRSAQSKDIESARDLEEQMKAHSLGSDEALKQGRVKRENMGALLTSLGLTASVVLEEGGMDVIRSASHALHKLFGGHNPGLPETLPQDASVPPMPLEHFSAPSGAPAAHLDSSLSIHGNVNNADRLFGHLRDELQQRASSGPGDGKDLPPALKTFFASGHSQDDLTRTLGFQHEGWNAPMHEGDTLAYSDKSHEIVFMRAGDQGPGTVVIDAKGQINHAGVARLFAQEHPPVQAVHAAVAPHEGAVPAHADVVSSGEEPLPIHTETSAVSSASGEASAAAAPLPTPDAESTTLGQMLGKVPAESVPDAVGVQGSDVSTTLGDMVHGSESVTAVTNAHNIEIPAGESCSYEWLLPKTESPRLLAYGGTPEESSAMAREYAASHPGGHMAFVRTVTDALGRVTRHVDEWTTDAAGRPLLVQDVRLPDGSLMPPPDPNDFITKISP